MSAKKRIKLAPGEAYVVLTLDEWHYLIGVFNSLAAEQTDVADYNAWVALADDIQTQINCNAEEDDGDDEWQ